MIVVDTGPFVALFDPRDRDHAACHRVLAGIDEPLYTTEAVLTEVFHMLEPASRGARGVKEFLLDDFVTLVPLDREGPERAFTLMDTYVDLPMDFADATLLVLAERLATTKVFTLDFADFSTYRMKRGHRHVAMKLMGIEILQGGRRSSARRRPMQTGSDS
jgi:predicted nucleic acid-binding protein